jgi:cytochrome b subunit of formate dehydrogenase
MPIVVALFLLITVLFFFPPAMRGQSAEECLMCHSDQSLSMQKRGKTIPLFVNEASLRNSTHASVACVACHEGFNAIEMPHAKVIKPVQCQKCHEIAGFDNSVHGRKVGGVPVAGCKECHGTHEILSPQNAKSAANRLNVASDCGKCHTQADQHFESSAHGVALVAGVKGAPSCVDCHGSHTIEVTASQESPMSKTREAKVCLNCHLDNPDVRQRVGPSAGFIQSYEASVHGVALAAGNQKAAVCSSCHGAHDMKKGSDPASLVNKSNIAQTCSHCHSDIAKTYNESIHGTALKAGNMDAPSCTDCHGEHQIYAPADPRSRVAKTNVSEKVCASCHNSVQLNQKYGLPAERFVTFSDSYHGLASRGGSVEVANCASCHGIHNIKPSSDPTSTISPANLAATCGTCHPGANQNFTKGSVHVVVASDHNAILYWIRIIYICLILGTIGGMLFHNLLDFARKAEHRLAIRQGRAVEEHHGTAQYVRMTLSERLQHAAMFSSFIVLVITGFMLKFPDAWWVIPIRQMSEGVFAVRSLAHRIAGVVMVGVSLYHLYYICITARGRRLVGALWPRLQDAKDVWINVLYYTGLSKGKPAFDRFGYIEKAEYWALVWGVIVMAGTGIIMWFDNYFIGILTKLGWDISRTVHYYEAILATLAILVWHFYFVIFNPSVYPMSTAWFNGKISEAEMAEEHPLELQRLKTAEKDSI